nr:MAG TPA: hypothetical protein [Caudoviricetes sp.]
MVEPTQLALFKFPSNNFGKKVGVITSTDYKSRRDYEYRVEWEGGGAAHYNQHHLSIHHLSLENK